MGDGSDTPGYFGWELCLKSSLSPSISPCSIQCQWELLPRNLKRAQQRLPLLGNNVRPFFRRLLRQQLYFTQLAAPGEEMECSQQSWATSWAGGERAGLPHWGFWGAEIVLCAHLEQKDEATGDDFSAVAHLLLGRPVLSPKPSRSCVCVCIPALCLSVLPKHPPLLGTSSAPCAPPVGYTRYLWAGASPSPGLGNSLF